MSTSQPNFRSLTTLAEVATRGLTSDPLVPIGDPAASYASRVLSPSQPGEPLIGGRASVDGPTRASPFRDGSLLRSEPYAAPIRASVVGSFDATPLGGGADHRHLGVATDQANALPGSHMTTSPVRDGYQVRRPPGHFPMGGNPAAGPSAPLFCGAAPSSVQFGATPIRDCALPDGHEAVPLPQDNIPPWPAQSTTPIGVNAAGDLIELPADNVHPPAPCDPAPFRAGASPVSGLEASLFGDGPRAPPVSSAAPLGAGAGSSHDVLLQEAARVIESLTGAMQHRETGQAAANEAGGSTEGWSTWFCSSAVGVPGRWLVVSVLEWLEAWQTGALLARSVTPDTRGEERPAMAGHFAILETARPIGGVCQKPPCRRPRSTQGYRRQRLRRLRRRRRALGPGVSVAGITVAGRGWSGRRRRLCPGAGDRRGRRGRDRRGGSGQNRIPGSGRCLPVPPRATPVGLSVATWTSQDGTEPPRFYVSRKPWGDQRRPEPGQALDRVPWPFRGRTVTEMDARAHGACLPSRPGDVFCRVCGGLLLHGDGNDRSLFHRSQAGGGDGDIIGPRRVDDPVEHTDAIRCFGARLARDPVFAAAALAVAGLQGVAVSAPATVPPRSPTPPTEDQAGPSGLQDLIDMDVDLDLF
ncbi:hypothetical protein HPB47_011699 [Ixodes persulcatus]|uniref:Uncharacterized protein n=1 Tax=Ixodes persulcatus TaxID=34615 RepID=A0AC60NVP8_IXOPE|nr:hypothetical protein HPB47_011699 [Ixodes persulcatus]